MNRRLAVLPRACLTLGMLMALRGSAWAGPVLTLGNPPISAAALNGVLIGNSDFVTIPVPGQPVAYTLATGISGPNQARMGAIRCAHLECALCLAQSELARGRTAARAVVDQVTCLLVVFCSRTPGV
jgi:hypothetical protein